MYETMQIFLTQVVANQKNKKNSLASLYFVKYSEKDSNMVRSLRINKNFFTSVSKILDPQVFIHS